MKACLSMAIFALTASTIPASLQDAEEEHARNRATVEAVFVDREDRPIAGVRVRSRFWPGTERITESDADGRFEVVLEWDAKRQRTWYEGYARREGYAFRKFRADLRSDEELDLGRLRLDPGGVLTGAVLDESGAPLSGAWLVVVNAGEHGAPPEGKQEEGPAGGMGTDHGGTDERGRYEIVGVPPGTWYVAAKHESTWWRSSAPVELRAEATSEIPAVRLEALPGSYRIEGRVVGPDDEPVAGADVSTAVMSPERRSMKQTNARTDESGRFVLFLARLPESTVDLRVRPQGETLDDGSLAGVQPGARDVLVRLGGTRELRLHVVDERGRPVEHYGWGLTVRKPDTSISTGSAPKYHAGGRASLRVPEHPFELEIRSEAHNREEVGELFPDSLPEVLQITLSASAAISGRVTFAGRPVAGAHVELVQRTPNYLDGVVEGHWDGLYYGSSSSTIRSGEDGRFRLPDDFPHLTYHVRAWKEGHAEGLSGAVRVGASDVLVELGEGGTVAGVVRAPGGLPSGDIELELYRNEREAEGVEPTRGRVFRTRVEADGSFEQPSLAPGTWLVRVEPSGTLISDLGWSEAEVEAEAHPHVVEVRDRETTIFDAVLGAGSMCALEGRLSVGDEIREGYAQLLLEGPHALDLDFSGLDAEGRFRLAAREPGTYRLVVDAGPGHHQYKTVTDLVELTPGTTLWERDLPVELWTGEGIRLDRP